MFDLETLRVIWWILLGVLLIGFAVTDGFDIGIAVLFPWVAREDVERRVVLNTIGSIWEGNQVWIILGAGAIFAAWPLVYAVAFSGFYLLMLLLLLTMGISRPVSFKYRSKLQNSYWRCVWDSSVFIGGVVSALIFGILIGNVLQGVPFQFDEHLRVNYSGTFLALFNPFALWCGLTSLMMLAMHGGIFLALKTEDPILHRACRLSQGMAVIFIFFFITGGWWLTHAIPGYQVTSVISPLAYSNPLHKKVEQVMGAWLNNYFHYPLMLLAPLLGIVGAFTVCFAIHWKKLKLAFIASSLSIIGTISTVGLTMFPFILPSSLDLASSLLVWDASSSQLTLAVMLGSTLIFMPLVILYTSWVYYILRGKITANDVMPGENQEKS